MTEKLNLTPGKVISVPIYVYLLWFHKEDGPEDTVATLKRDCIVEMCRTAFPKYIERYLKEDKVDTIGNLQEILEKPDEELADYGGGNELGPDWGCLHLQVVKLK